ncbi:MAG: YceI family protein [Candidatus Latescibacteria bacterium]|nr:YceI family protein [Candidatus Latescibacterota bacterium]
MLQRFMIVIALGFLGVSPILAETPLGLAVEGVQKIRLNNKVGKSQIKFVSEAPMENIHGTASDIVGDLTFDPANLEEMTARIEVGVASMETGIKKRDEHLHSKDWLDAEQFSKIIFEVKELKDVSVKAQEAKADIKATAMGQFTLHGIIKEISIPVEMTYLLASEKTKKRASGDFFVIKGKFQIALKDFDISGNRGMVGSRVGTEIELDANFFGSTVSDAAKE